MDFLGPHLGGSRWSCPKKFPEKKLHLQLNNFTQKLNFDVLWFRKRRAYKYLEEKKKKNLIAAKSGLVGMKGYLETYNSMKYFLPYLSRFWLRPLFTPNLRGGFRILKSKSRDLLPRNLVQTCNSLISNCCQNFMKQDQIVLEL